MDDRDDRERRHDREDRDVYIRERSPSPPSPPSRPSLPSRPSPQVNNARYLLESSLSSYVYGNRLKTFRTFDNIFDEFLVKIKKDRLDHTDYTLTREHVYNKYLDIATANAPNIVNILLERNGRSDAKNYRSDPNNFLDNLVSRWLSSNEQEDYRDIKLNEYDVNDLKKEIIRILNQEIIKQQKQQFDKITTGLANLGTTEGGKAKYNKTYCRRHKKTRRCRNKKTRRRRYRK